MGIPSQLSLHVCRPHRIASIWVPRRGTPRCEPGLFDTRAYRRFGTLVESQPPETGSDLTFKVKDKRAASPEEERRYPLDQYPRLRTRPFVVQCTRDPPPPSAYAQASTLQRILRSPSRSCEGLISCRSGCPLCGRTKSRQIVARLSVTSFHPCPAATQARGREARVLYVRHHLPVKPRTRVLLVPVGERIFRHQNAGNRWFPEMKTRRDH